MPGTCHQQALEITHALPRFSDKAIGWAPHGTPPMLAPGTGGRVLSSGLRAGTEGESPVVTTWLSAWLHTRPVWERARGCCRQDLPPLSLRQLFGGAE